VTDELIEGYRLAPVQQRIWRVQAGAPFFTRATVRLQGPLDEARLTAALAELPARREILRTTFHPLPGLDVPVQVIGSHGAPLLHARLRHDAEGPLLDLHLPSLCADLRSLTLLMHALARAYDGDVGDDPAAYLSYAEWHNQLLADPDRPLIRCAAPTPPALPADGNGTPVTLTHAIDLALPPRPASWFFTLWSLLLARLLGHGDVEIECEGAGRSFDELAEAIGCFAGYVPVRLPLPARATVAMLVDSAAAALRAAEEMQPYAVRETVAALPLGFSWEPWPEPARAAALTFTLQERHSERERFHLHLAATQRERTLIVELSSSGRYGTTTLERLAHRLEHLLRQAVARPDLPVEALDLVPRDERQRLHAWNATAVPIATEATLHQRFSAQAAMTPERVAVRDGGASLRFGELDLASDAVAAQLERVGVRRGGRVAVLCERSAATVAAVLGALKAGAAFVPIDPGDPAARIAFLLDDAQPIAVVGPARLRPLVANGIAWLPLEETLRLPRVQSPPDGGAGPDDIAYVIYTSGSTGAPKGACVSHRSVVHLAEVLQRTAYAGLPASVRVTLNAPLSFDASIKQLVQLLFGRTLIVVPEAARRDGAALLALLAAEAVDVLDCTPSHLRLLRAAGLLSGAASARRVLVGGEPIDAETWQALTRHPALEFVNVYGPTECTVNASFAPVLADQSPSIGRPLPNVRIELLDERLEPVGIGAVGELFIGGAGVALGYHARPALTAERFLPDPHVAGARRYRSGDFGRQLPDGRIELLGRRDDQVKLRGYRIELGEIESALRRHPALGDVAVMTREDRPGERRLVAYVTPAATLHRLANGLRVAHQNRNETDYLYDEIWVKRSYLRHGVRLYDGMCVLDVGANIGLFSLFVAQHCQARIYAFEPLPALFETLRANLALHGADAVALPFGLAEGERSESFTFYPRYTMMSGAAAYADAPGEVEVIRQYLRNSAAEGALLERVDDLLEGRFAAERVSCRLRPLSAVVCEQRLGRIDLLKIDVQRAELDVLRGLDDGDWDKVRQVVMEVHDAPAGPTHGRTGEIRALLQRRGFVVVVEQDALLAGTDRYNLYAVRPDAAPQPEPRPRALPMGLDGASLRAWLAEQLPEYMVPAAVVVLDALPLTRNGKVDRAAVPSPEAAPPQRRAVTPPRSAEEQLLAQVWRDVLGVTEVGIDDNFFDLGGDSIRSIQVQALAQKRGVTFTLQQLFTHQHIAALAAHVTRAPAPPRDAAFALCPEADRARLPDGIADAYPLAKLQAGMLFHSERTNDGATYHNVSSVRVRARFDATALRHALDGLLAAHPILRTTFDLGSFSEPLQLVHAAVVAPLEVVDVRDLSPRAQDEIIERAIEAERTRHFDWQSPPLLRFLVHRRDEGSFQLTYAEYHAILDGWSLHAMLTELSLRYVAALGQPVSLPPPPSYPFRRFVALEREATRSAESLAFFRRTLAGAHATRVPGVVERAAPRESRRWRALVPAEIASALGATAQHSGVPLKSVLLAAHVDVLASTTAVDEVTTGLVMNARPEEHDGDRVLGLFLNLVPFRLGARAASWLELARAAFATERELLPHRRFPYAEIERQLGPLGLQTFFNFTHFHALATGAPALEEQRTIAVDIDFPLATDFELHSDGTLELSLLYDATALHDAQVAHLGDAYLAALSACAANAESAPRSSLLAPALPPVTTRLGTPPRPVLDDPPRDDIEARLSQIFAETLGLPRIGVHDPFFEVGGHSLLAARVVARTRQAFGIQLPLSELFEAPSVARLAERVSRRVRP
jgi:amino acid adenylation domain-containing protein/FkbM family methyltransferase